LLRTGVDPVPGTDKMTASIAGASKESLWNFITVSLTRWKKNGRRWLDKLTTTHDLHVSCLILEILTRSIMRCAVLGIGVNFADQGWRFASFHHHLQGEENQWFGLNVIWVPLYC